MPNEQRIDALIHGAQSIITEQGVTRDALGRVLVELQSLASDKELWFGDRFPDPDEGEQQARYLIREDPGNKFTLYLNVMRPGKRIPPHNHTTWACIAAVDGREYNTLYERADDGTGAGPAQLREVSEIVVEPGRGIALLPDDIHSVEIRNARIIRHLHFYGQALESLSERLSFDLDAGIAKPMSLGVKTRR